MSATKLQDFPPKIYFLSDLHAAPIWYLWIFSWKDVKGISYNHVHEVSKQTPILNIFV